MEENTYQATDYFVNNKLIELPIHMKYRETRKSFYMKLHSHTGYEIYFLQEGTGCFLIEENIYPLEGNDLILIGAQESHKSSPNLQIPSTRTVIHFLPELLDDEVRSRFLDVFHANNPNRHIRLNNDKLQRILYLQEKLYEEYTMQNNGDILALRIYLNELLLEIHRLVSHGSTQDLEPIARNTISPKIEEAVKYLSKHYCEEISLEKLAQDLYISSYYLCHLFKKTIGLTITDFLNQTRIQQAKHLLNNTNMPILDISEAVGFNSFSNFGRVFKKIVGSTPRSFRKLKQG